MVSYKQPTNPLVLNSVFCCLVPLRGLLSESVLFMGNPCTECEIPGTYYLNSSGTFDSATASAPGPMWQETLRDK